MLGLLNKYRKWLLCFFSSLLIVLSSSVVFAQEAPTFKNVDVAVNTQQTGHPSEYLGFVESHLEPNFYQ